MRNFRIWLAGFQSTWGSRVYSSQIPNQPRNWRGQSFVKSTVNLTIGAVDLYIELTNGATKSSCQAPTASSCNYIKVMPVKGVWVNIRILGLGISHVLSTYSIARGRGTGGGGAMGSCAPSHFFKSEEVPFFWARKKERALFAVAKTL
jgi:hypothetical protein